MKKIAILFSGTGSNFAHIVKTMHQKEIEVSVALTNNLNAKGIDIAKKHHIPLIVIDQKKYSSREEFDKEIVDSLETYSIDLAVLAGFMRILTDIFTSNIKAINLHPSLLPRHKGLHAIEKSYEDAYPEGGVTVHEVNSELDGGKIVLQKIVPKENLTFEMYDKKIRIIEKDALCEAIRVVLSQRIQPNEKI